MKMRVKSGRSGNCCWVVRTRTWPRTGYVVGLTLCLFLVDPYLAAIQVPAPAADLGSCLPAFAAEAAASAE